MPLTLVTGPANSGKTGEVLERFAATLDSEPVLAVPTLADVERYEQELLARRPVAVGGRIVTLAGLVRLAASAAGVDAPPLLTAAQREAVLAAVVREARLEVLREPARRRGFVPALAGFLDELQGARLEPDALTRRAGAHLRELARLYAGYRERLARLGRGDEHTLAAATVAGLQEDPAAWGARPVFLHGFDDLTLEQLALLDSLQRGTEVLVSVVHEPGRACLAARERLLGRLESLGPAEIEAREPQEGEGLLVHLERSFLRDQPERRAPDASLALLDASGRRAEAEAVGAELVRLLRAGERPGDLVVISRSPEEHAPLLEQVLESYAVPVAVDAWAPFPATGLGRGLLALLRVALPGGTAADLVAFLRTPGAAGPGAVDALERDVRERRLETAAEAERAWAEGERRELWELRALRAAEREGPAALARAAAAAALRLFAWPLRREAPELSPALRRDQLAAEHAARALEEVAQLAELDPAAVPGPAGLVGLLEDLRVPRFAGPTTGRVEVISPYRARARRFGHAFVLGLGEGEFPRRGGEDPFLSDDERAEVGLPERADPADEERYLFYVCLSRPLHSLQLSWRSTDEGGGELTRSFFVDDLLEALEPAAEERITAVRDLSATVFRPDRAPTARELARSLALARIVRVPAELGASDALRASLERLLGEARERADRLPGPLTLAAVRSELEARTVFGASSLERYAECPFRYFVDHELRPRRLEPEADPLARGSLVHAVLEDLYREHGRPTEDTLAEYRRIARRLMREKAEGTALAPVSPAARAAFRAMEADVLRFLDYDATDPVGLEPLAIELGFGEREDDERPPLQLDGIAIHGRIDRVDGTDGGIGFVRDYKSGRRVPSRAQLLADRKLQLPLYLIALRELWGLDPVGGVYHPLGAPEGERPRGILRGPREEAPVHGESFVKSDFCPPDEFEATLAEAADTAVELGGRIRQGHLARDPLGGACPRHCDFHPICRRERGQKNPPEETNGNGRNGNGGGEGA